MTTKTKSPTTEQASKTAKREEKYAKVQRVKRKHTGHTEMVEAKRGEATARRHSHPEEHAGPDEQFAPLPGTVAAKMHAEVKELMAGPNPFEAELNEAKAEYAAAELDERTHRARHLQEIIDEQNADLDEDDAELTAALRTVADLTGRRLAKADEVRRLVAGTSGLDGRCFEQDPRVLEWHQFATAAAEQRLDPPGITDAGKYQLRLQVADAEGRNNE